MVKGTVLRIVAVMEDKDETLFDPWLQLKLVFLLIDSELEPNDFDSAELNVFWHKNEVPFLLVTKDGVSRLKKEAQDVGAKQQHEIFLIHYFALQCNKCYWDVFVLSLAKQCCVTDDTGGVIAFVIVPIHQCMIGMVY
jgi:hypothetical protein